MTGSVCISAACFLGLAAAGGAQSAISAPPYTIRPLNGVEIGRRTLADIAVAESVAVLSAVRLPQGTRELRLAGSYSMIGGYPSPALRLIESGNDIRGEMVFFWLERPGSRRRLEATRCTAGVDSTRVCVHVVPTSKSPDWQQVAARLDTLGAWTIRERCEDNRMISDAGDLNLERLDGARFEEYSCNAPSDRRGTPAADRARALYTYFDSLTRVVWR
jgi:hypothetical protein